MDVVNVVNNARRKRAKVGRGASGRRADGYWSVHVGHEPGIYGSWADCKVQIKDIGSEKAEWKRFDRTEAGFEDAKTFCRYGEAMEMIPEKDGSSEESSDDSDEYDPSMLMIRLETNWSRDKHRQSQEQKRKSPPQYAVVFDLDMDDPRNLYDLFTMPRPTQERCILMALVSFLQWCNNPDSAQNRRGGDILLEDAADYLEPFDADTVRRIVIQTPCKRVEHMFDSTKGGKKTQTCKGLARTAQGHLGRLARRDIDVVFITVDQAPENIADQLTGKKDTISDKPSQ